MECNKIHLACSSTYLHSIYTVHLDFRKNLKTTSNTAPPNLYTTNASLCDGHGYFKTTDRWTRNTGRLPISPLIQMYKVTTLSVCYSTSVIAYLKYLTSHSFSYSYSSFLGLYPKINSSITMLRRIL